MKKKKLHTRWQRYITKEIGIEFKACLYFFAILFFYCVYRLLCGSIVADILHMWEMIITTYVMGYVQVYFLWNFDEADTWKGKEIAGIFISTLLYTAVSFAGKWFGRSVSVTIVFACYIVFLYICMFIIYKIKRSLDDKILNDDLDMFKARKKNEK